MEGVKIRLRTFLTLALDGGEWTALFCGLFLLWKIFSTTHRIGGCVRYSIQYSTNE
jgi:hypothetical protein